MKTNYGKIASDQNTPQTAPLRRGTKQVQNNAGGFVYQLDAWGQLERFVILGASGGTYYVSERKLATENADSVLKLIAEDAQRVWDTVRNLSLSGRAASNDPAVFVTAMLAIHALKEAKQAVYEQLNDVLRTGTDLFHFMEFYWQLKGKPKATPSMGAGLRRALARWYTKRQPHQLAYQVVKYRQRDNWTHASVLRLCHAKPPGPEYDAIFRFIMGETGQATIQMANPDSEGGLFGERQVTRMIRRPVGGDKPSIGDTLRLYGSVRAHLPEQIGAYLEAKALAPEKGVKARRQLVGLITEHGLPREAVPSEWLNDPEVWMALLQRMPLAAMIRSLAQMQQVGVLESLSGGASLVVGALSTQEKITKSRLHPMKVLMAAKVYGAGKNFPRPGQDSRHFKQKLWTPNQRILDALDAAFYMAFHNVQPSGKKQVLGLDVSGSMGAAITPVITCREAAAAMALVTANVEPEYALLGFSHQLIELPISPRMRLHEAVRVITGIPFGATDTALPVLWAQQRKIANANFATYTDNETWAGPMHTTVALQNYRRTLHPEARMVACAMTATKYSICDPADALSLNVVGMDAATPSLIANFFRGTTEPVSEEEAE